MCGDRFDLYKWWYNRGASNSAYRAVWKGRIAMACTVTVTNGTLEQGEIDAYIDRARKKFGVEPKHINITLCGDEVELDYELDGQPFQRIRRITGYLVGTLDRFNNAKRSEEKDRVKHTIA